MDKLFGGRTAALFGYTELTGGYPGLQVGRTAAARLSTCQEGEFMLPARHQSWLGEGLDI
jgi:hypothetical protein